MKNAASDATSLLCHFLIAPMLAVLAGSAAAQCAQWAPPSPGTTDDAVLAMCVQANGDVYAGGMFKTIGGTAANNIARWDGTAWQPLGSGMSGASGFETVTALALLPNGGIVAAGVFASAGGIPANGVAQWNGSSWAPLGSGIFSGGMTTTPNGDVFVGAYISGGIWGLLRWNGIAWTTVAQWQGGGGAIHTMISLPTGEVVLGGNGLLGNFSTAAIWDGSTLSPLGVCPVGIVRCFARLPNGDLVAGGGIQGSGTVARWNGSLWQPLGGGFLDEVNALQTLPNGDLVAGGSFSVAYGAPADHLARWNGTSWSPMGAGTDGGVRALALDPAGQLLVGGWFQAAGGLPSAHLARYVSTCPAAAVATGTGCTGSGGPNLLRPVTQPWLHATWRAQGQGFANSSLVFAATGTSSIAQGIVPLPAVLAQALPGCDLLVTPEFLQAIITTTGVAESQITVPASPILIGLTLHHQMVAFELATQGGFVAITATNALTLTIGDF